MEEKIKTCQIKICKEIFLLIFTLLSTIFTLIPVQVYSDNTINAEDILMVVA